MPHTVNIPENTELLEVYAGDGFDAPRIDPDTAQQHLKNQFRQYLKEHLELVLEQEALEQLQAQWYERDALDRQDYRNGYRERSIATTLGVIDLQVPRARSLSLSFSVFEAYQRRWREVDALLMEAYIGGMSCRTAARRLGAILGIELSGATVAGLISKLEDSLLQFRSAPLKDEYVALVIDGMYVRIKQCMEPKRPVVAVIGIKANGEEVLLSFRVCYSENSVEVQGILHDLKSRGLRGAHLEVVTLDGNQGLESAVRSVFGLVRIQDCIFHRINRLHRHAQSKNRARCMMKEASEAFALSDARLRRRALKAFSDRWREKEPKAIERFEHQLQRCFEVDVLPPHLRSKASTTSLCECLFGQLRKRIKQIGAFETPRATELFVLANIRQKQWISVPGLPAQSPLLPFTHSY